MKLAKTISQNTLFSPNKKKKTHMTAKLKKIYDINENELHTWAVMLKNIFDHRFLGKICN